MRQILAVCIIISLLAQTFSRIFIIADYYANTAAYAKNCINKAMPKMHCNGKCQMMKKILQTEKKDRENTERRENLKNEVISSNSFFGILQFPEIKSTAFLKIFYYSCANVTDRSVDIFHPPQA